MNADAPNPLRFLRNVILKGLLLFLLVNLAAAALDPGALGKVSAYNYLFPGRERFPFGENPSRSYNLSLYNLDAMFAAHEIAAGSKPAGEYRVALIGDSSVWGTLLRPDQTLAGQLNGLRLKCRERAVRVYNLGYPTISLTKDVMLLRRALAYQPDLILWPTTLEAFPRDKQLVSPLVANNAADVRALEQQTGLALESNSAPLVQPSFWQRSLIGQRRALADLLRLQLYGVMWAATGIDQEYPEKFQPAQLDFEADASFHDWQPPNLPEDALAFDVLAAGVQAAGNIPVLLVNEPMLISAGKNSQIRYNFYYPRWAYDQYRQALAERARAAGWDLLDIWDSIPAAEFTNSAIHLTPHGEALTADRIGQAILAKCNR